jgi:hypothetical protein
VNHQIQNHVDVQAAGAEFTHAVNFEKQGLGDRGLKGDDGGVKPLEVADQQDSMEPRRVVNQAARGGRLVRDGFFHQYIDAELHEPASDVGVSNSGRRDHRRVRMFREMIERVEHGASMGFRGLARARAVQVENAGQFGTGGLMNHSEVVAPERACAHHGDTRFGHLRKASRPSGVEELGLDG